MKQIYTILFIFVCASAWGQSGRLHRLPEIDTVNIISTQNYVGDRTFLFSQDDNTTYLIAQSSKKTWVVSDTITISGNLDVSDLDIIFEKNGFISGADTITANGATIQANKNKQLWSNTTVITGNWNVEKAYLEWTVGSSLSDSLTNFHALTNAIEIGDVQLLAKTYRVSPSDLTESYTTEKNITIRGESKEESMLVLCGQRNNGYTYQFDPANLVLEGITLTERDYLDGTYYNTSIYLFVGGAYHATFNPDFTANIDYVKINNCNVNGAIQVAGFAPTIDNQTIEEYSSGGNRNMDISVTNTVFNRGAISFALSNGGFNSIYFDKVSCYDFSEAFFIAPISDGTSEFLDSTYAMRGDIVSVTDCIFENRDTVNVADTRALTTVKFKSLNTNLVISNTLVKGLRNTNPLSFVQPFYYTGQGEVTVTNTQFINNIGAGIHNTFIRQKNGKKYTFDNCKFNISKQSFVDVGILDSLSQSLAMLDNNTDFYLIQCDNNAEQNLNYNISNSEFSTPYLSLSANMSALEGFRLENNSFNIGRYGPSSPSSESYPYTFFYNNERLNSTNQNAGKFISKGNVWNVNSTSGSDFWFFRHSTGTQNGSSDTTYYFDFTSIDDEFFLPDGVRLNTDLLDSKKQTISFAVNGNNNDIGLREWTDSNHKRPMSELFSFGGKVHNYTNSNNPIFNISSNSSQELEVVNNYADSLILFQTSTELRLNKLSSHLPTQVVIDISYRDTNNVERSTKFQLLLSDLYSGTVTYLDSINNSDVFNNVITTGGQSTPYEVQPYGDTNIRLFVRDDSGPDSYVLRNMGGMSSFKIKVSCKPSVIIAEGASTTLKSDDLKNKLEIGTSYPIRGNTGKELTLESVTNPYGGSNELGSTITSMSNKIDTVSTDIRYKGFTAISTDPSVTLSPRPGEVYYFDTTSAGWTQEFNADNLQTGDRFRAYFISTDVNTLTLDATTGGFIRPNSNGDTAADATEDISTLGFIEVTWDGNNFLIFE